MCAIRPGVSQAEPSRRDKGRAASARGTRPARECGRAARWAGGRGAGRRERAGGMAGGGTSHGAMSSGTTTSSSILPRTPRVRASPPPSAHAARARAAWRRQTVGNAAGAVAGNPPPGVPDIAARGGGRTGASPSRRGATSSRGRGRTGRSRGTGRCASRSRAKPPRVASSPQSPPPAPPPRGAAGRRTRPRTCTARRQPRQRHSRGHGCAAAEVTVAPRCWAPVQEVVSGWGRGSQRRARPRLPPSSAPASTSP